jgi:hypothetical protein
VRAVVFVLVSKLGSITVRVFVLLVCPCILVAAINEINAPSPEPDTALDRALQEFKTDTQALGIRPGSTHSELKAAVRKPVWHGRLFENFRNDVLDAVPHEIKQQGGDKSLLQRNQFGFNISGPVVIPHVFKAQSNTFFSLSYEGVRESIARTYLRTVPTLSERIGDFSQTVDQAGNRLPIYDPATTRVNPNYDPAQVVSTANLQYLRDPFPDNRIPSTRFDSVARDALSLYPRPNANVGPFFQNYFFVNSPETNIADGFLGKVDQSLETAITSRLISIRQMGCWVRLDGSLPSRMPAHPTEISKPGGANQTLVDADHSLELMHNNLKEEKAKTSELESSNATLKAQIGVAANSPRTAELLAQLNEITRRRESCIREITSRYRDVTSQYQSLTGALAGRQNQQIALWNSAELSRIQSAINSEEDNLRRLDELNAQTALVERRLSKH